MAICAFLGSAGVARAGPHALVPIPKPHFSIDLVSPSNGKPTLGGPITAGAILDAPGPNVTFPAAGLRLSHPADELDEMSGNRFDVGPTDKFVILFGVDRASAGYLFGAYSGQTPLLGGGISAMPSMHVAIVTLNLCLYTGVNRWLAIPTGAYAVLVLIGSVHFGWHYAIDGYVSIAAVLALWWLAGRLARPSPAAAAANA